MIGLFEQVSSLDMVGPFKPVESFDMVGPYATGIGSFEPGWAI